MRLVPALDGLEVSFRALARNLTAEDEPAVTFTAVPEGGE
jgi:hypothetical protein